jgi:hypothetical protein
MTNFYDNLRHASTPLLEYIKTSEAIRASTPEPTPLIPN